ncbi:hypothetical protein R6Q57_016586 [Mikania cordata]
MEGNKVLDENVFINRADLENDDYIALRIHGQSSPTVAEEKRGDNLKNCRLLSSREMESLVAICDTFFPSTDVCKDRVVDDSLAQLYHTSASMNGIPNLVAMIMLLKSEHPKQFLVRLTLWFLSTWIGTLVLCGKACLSNQFPYVQKFSKVSAKKREEILISWSLSYFFLLRMLFRGLKTVVPLAYFTQASSLFHLCITITLKDYLYANVSLSSLSHQHFTLSFHMHSLSSF